jgi:hypothetical protein
MTASSVFNEYLKDELARQDARKASFEQRGVAVVTTAGTLVTLLFGLAALSTAAGAHIGAEEKVWLAVALVLFLVCAGFALAPSFPVAYKSIDIQGFMPVLNAEPEYDEPDAAHAVAELRASIVESAQKKTSFKGTLLFAALLFELAAVLCVGVAIFEVVDSGTKTMKPPITHHHHLGVSREQTRRPPNAVPP